MSDDPEIKAMSAIAEALTGLESEAVSRVLRYAAERHNISLGRPSPSAQQAKRATERQAEVSDEKTFSDVASFYDAANPRTEPEKVLVIGYWFQEVEKQEELESQLLNTTLKNMGHGVSNITKSFQALMNHSPRWAIQTKKAGTSKQARKKYRITTEGIKRVRAMINGQAPTEDEA